MIQRTCEAASICLTWPFVASPGKQTHTPEASDFHSHTHAQEKQLQGRVITAGMNNLFLRHLFALLPQV